MSSSQKAYFCFLVLEKIALLVLILIYYPRSWMLEYLDVVVSSSDPSSWVKTVYLADECDQNIVTLPFYGTTHACYRRDRSISYLKCGNEVSGFSDIHAIHPRKLNKVPGGLSVCIGKSEDTLSTEKPVSFKFNDEQEF